MKVLETINGGVHLDTEGLSSKVAAQILAAAIVKHERLRQGKESDPAKLEKAVKNYYHRAQKRAPDRRRLIDLPSGIRIAEDPECQTRIVVSSRFGRAMLSNAALKTAERIIKNYQATGRISFPPDSIEFISSRLPTLNQLAQPPKPTLNQSQGAS